MATPTTKVATGKVATTKVTSTADTKAGITLGMAEAIFSKKKAATTRTVGGTRRATTSSMGASSSNSRSAPTTTTTGVPTGTTTKISRILNPREVIPTSLTLISASKAPTPNSKSQQVSRVSLLSRTLRLQEKLCWTRKLNLLDSLSILRHPQAWLLFRDRTRQPLGQLQE